VVLLPALLLYPCRSFHLLEPDEGRYAQIPREMHASGEWVVPRLQGEPYLDKPPLLYWLVALSYRVFGVSPESARLVPAVCVHLTILAVYFLGRRSLGGRAAAWAAVLLTVSPVFIGVARLLLLDGLLTLCVTVSVMSGFEAVRTGNLKSGWWLASALASGLGFLTKGPISEMLLFPPLFAFAFLNGGTARVRWPYLLLFVGIVLGVNLPWYVAMGLREPKFLWHFFWEHNVLRFLQPFDHLQPVWYYVPILLGGLLPGVLLFIPYFRELLFGRLDRGRPARTAAGGFWLLAGAWCIIFFSLSGSKLPTYILPAFPFLCLALGDYVARSRWQQSSTARSLVAATAVVMLAVQYAGVPWYAKERSPVGRPELVERFVADPAVVIVTYPRNCDSLAYFAGRSDFDLVRSKDVNQLIVDMHHRPRTVVLFTHRHAFEAFKHALPESLAVTESVSLKRKPVPVIDKLVGDTPWGLADVAVIEPATVARAQRP
jgi:4-amino-4-deoxy-L-arabinose transferase-like glycosyltransferase